MRGSVVIIAVLAMACNGTTPSAPSGPSSTPPARGELSGIVTADGVPMAAARVVLWHANNVGVEVATATTHATGHYRMSEIEPSSRFGEFVVTSKSGYFREFVHLNITAQSEVATTLTPWDHIVLGTVLSRRIRYDMCK